jgi:rod shape-determining protein MreD
MKEGVKVLFLMILAAALQGLYPSWLMISGVKPDLILVVLIWASLRGNPVSGALLGFAAGLIHGAVVGTRFAAFIGTRTMCGFLAGSVTVRLFGENPLVPALAAFGLTVATEFLFLALGPAGGLFASIRLVMIEAGYNAGLVIVMSVISSQLALRKRIRLAQARWI